MYHVEVPNDVRKSIARLPKHVREHIHQATLDLADNPRPPGCRKLAGLRDRWRIRVGAYRILYDIHDDRLIIVIVRASHRKDAYRD